MQNTLSTSMIFNTELLLIKELTHLTVNGPIIMEITGFTTCAPFLSCQIYGIVEWSFEDSYYSARWVAIPWRPGARFFKRLSILSYHPRNGTVSPIARIYGSRNQGGRNESSTTHNYANGPLAKFLLFVSANFCSVDLEILVLERECFHQEACHNFIELEIKTTTYPLWALHISKSTHKGNYYAGWDDWSWLPKGY